MNPRQEALQDLEVHFAAIAKSFDRRFDTHEFILRLAKWHQHAYIRALATYEEVKHPFMSLHGEIGRRLSTRDDFQKVGERDSPDIFGEKNSAVVWERR